MIHKHKYHRKISIIIIVLISTGFVAAKASYAVNKRAQDKICIVPIGPLQKGILNYAIKELEESFNMKVVIEEELGHPKYAYNEERKQYYSTEILREIVKQELLEYDRILGVADVDLYVPELTFVFGEANIAHKVAVISLTRLRQEFYGLPEDNALFEKRTTVEAVHELGHTYGLRHCKQDNCVMFFSTSIDDTDNKGQMFCKLCKRKLFGRAHKGD